MHVQCHQTHRFSLWRCERVSPCHVPCLLRVCWQDFRLSVAASCKGAQDLTTHRAPCRSGEGLWPGSLAEIYGSKKDSAQQNCWDMLNLTQWCSYLSIRRPFKLNDLFLLTFLVNICFDKSNWNTRAEVRQSTYELPLWSNWNVSRQLLITCTLCWPTFMDRHDRWQLTTWTWHTWYDWGSLLSLHLWRHREQRLEQDLNDVFFFICHFENWLSGAYTVS